MGNYTEYRTFIKDYEAEKKKGDSPGPKGPRNDKRVIPGEAIVFPKKRKLSYKEQQELKKLEELLPQLETEKAQLEALLSGGTQDLAALQAASARYGALKEELDTAEMRWLELSEN